MVHIGGGRYVTAEEARKGGYAPRLDRPVRGASFFGENALTNAFLIVFSLAAYYYLAAWLEPIVANAVSVVLP